ncbi:unnamed protein product [Rhizopus stolonifer]
MCDPVSHGLPENFCLSERDCNVIHIPLYFSRLPVEKWLDCNAVSRLIIEHPTTLQKQANKILTSFVSDLGKIKSNKHTRFNLANYCSDVMDYYKVAVNKKSANLVIERAFFDNIENLENDIHSREGGQMNEPSSSHHETLLSKESNHKSVLIRIVEFEAKLHERYVQGDAISEQETDITKICLSSILDLVDLNRYGQIQSIFKDNYQQIISKHSNMFPCTVTARFKAKCKASNNSSDAIQYLQKTLGGKKESKVIEQVLDILDEEKLLLQNISNINLIMEEDIVSKVWAPLFKKVLSIGDNLVRTKLGGFISQYSQAEKQLQSVNVKNVKILRKGKDVLDGVLNTVIPEDDAKIAIGHAIQIKGLCVQVISVYLASTGLYVANQYSKYISQRRCWI